jgi:TRAP-type mannitol/chloroaromatic compound transport system permease small subunit
MASKILKSVDWLSEWSGKLVSWLIIPLFLVFVYDVIARYIFNKPSFWVFDISYMLGGTFFLIGGAYVLRYQRHVRVDLIYANLTPKKRAIIDLVFTLILFFPLVTMLFWYSIESTQFSWQIGERSMETPWRPPIYHFKAVMPVAFFLLLMQGIAEFSRNVIFLITGKQA